jgi:hypothetical protein
MSIALQVVTHRKVVRGHLTDGAQGHCVVLTARRHLVGHDVGDLQVRLAQRGVGGPLSLLGLLDLRGQRLGPLQDGGPLLRARPANGLRGGLLLGPQVVGAADGLAAGGVSGQQCIDQGLVGTPGALAGTDGVGVLAYESEVDHSTDGTEPPLRGAAAEWGPEAFRRRVQDILVSAGDGTWPGCRPGGATMGTCAFWTALGPPTT